MRKNRLGDAEALRAFDTSEACRFERSWIGGEVADDGLEEQAGLLGMRRLMERLAGKVE